MNKFTKFTASIVAAGAITLGAGSAAFASSPTPTDPTTEQATKKHTKAEICANKAEIEAKIATHRQAVVDRIAKLNQVKIDKAAELTKHPKLAEKLDARIKKLNDGLAKIDGRVAKIEIKCTAPTAPANATPANA